MPNWCDTSICFYGDTQEIKRFYKNIDFWMSEDFRATKTDFGDSWLGNILYGAGLQDRIDHTDPEKSIRCRGSVCIVTDIEEYNDEISLFTINTETAWVPMIKMWSEVIKKLGLHIKLCFFAEEPGCELYWVYDPEDFYFSGNEIFIDVYYGGDDKDLDNKLEDICGYYTEIEAKKVLQEFLGTDNDDLDILIRKANSFFDDYDDRFIGVHKIERITDLDGLD